MGLSPSSSGSFPRAAAADLWSNQALPELCFPAVVVSCPLHVEQGTANLWDYSLGETLESFPISPDVLPSVCSKEMTLFAKGTSWIGLCLVWGGRAAGPCCHS